MEYHECGAAHVRRARFGTLWWWVHRPFADDMQSMEFGGCQDDVARTPRCTIHRRRAFANLTEQCTRSVKLRVDSLQANDSSTLRQAQEIVERMRMHREISALMEAGSGSADPHHNTARVRDPSIRPSNNRKESRTSDCLEGGSNKKSEICPGVYRAVLNVYLYFVCRL